VKLAVALLLLLAAAVTVVAVACDWLLHADHLADVGDPDDIVMEVVA
jgi:hypothetical protein